MTRENDTPNGTETIDIRDTLRLNSDNLELTPQEFLKIATEFYARKPGIGMSHQEVEDSYRTPHGVSHASSWSEVRSHLGEVDSRQARIKENKAKKKHKKFNPS